VSNTAAAATASSASSGTNTGIVMPSTLTIGGGDPQSDDELRLYCAFRYFYTYMRTSSIYKDSSSVCKDSNELHACVLVKMPNENSLQSSCLCDVCVIVIVSMYT
jgi:hypothetical protein